MSYLNTASDDLDDKISFHMQLVGEGRPEEALTLCTTYLDGIPNWLAGVTGAQHNFSHVLGAYGGGSVFGLILSGELLRLLPWKSAPRGLTAAAKDRVSKDCCDLTWPRRRHARP